MNSSLWKKKSVLCVDKRCLTILTFKVNTKEVIVNVMNFERLWSETPLPLIRNVSQYTRKSITSETIYFPAYLMKRNNGATFKFVFCSCLLRTPKLSRSFITPALKTFWNSTQAPTLKLHTLYKLVSVISILWGWHLKKNSCKCAVSQKAQKL